MAHAWFYDDDLAVLHLKLEYNDSLSVFHPAVVSLSQVMGASQPSIFARNSQQPGAKRGAGDILPGRCLVSRSRVSRSVAIIVVLLLVAACDNNDGPQFVEPSASSPSALNYRTGEISPTSEGGSEGEVRSYTYTPTATFFLPQLPTTQVCSVLDGGVWASTESPAWDLCRYAPVRIIEATVFSITRDLGRFWNSQFIACDCSDTDPTCQNNAFVNSAYPGYIWYDDYLINSMTAWDSLVPVSYVMAHEAAHHIQFRHDISYPYPVNVELSADCMAGYFLGYLSCTGQVDGIDVDTAMNEICMVGDLPGTPWWDVNAHGTCQQRVTAALDGVAGYALRIPPKEWCTR